MLYMSVKNMGRYKLLSRIEGALLTMSEIFGSLKLKIPKTIDKSIRKVSKRIRTTNITMTHVIKKHEKYNWNFKKFIEKISRGKPSDDWQFYSNVIYSDLNRLISKRGWPKEVTPFIKSNKEFSAILGNWVFNSHLRGYSRCWNPLFKNIIIYVDDPIIKNAISVAVYNTFRLGGCHMSLVKTSNYPRRIVMVDEENTIEKETNRIFKEWTNVFWQIDLSHVTDFNEIEFFKTKVISQNTTLFGTRYPLIIFAPTCKVELNNSKIFEFEVTYK